MNGNFNNSTAIGYNSQPTSDNQIMLGTNAETVICPSTVSINGLDTTTQIIGYNNISLINIGSNIIVL